MSKNLQLEGDKYPGYTEMLEYEIEKRIKS